MTKISGTKEYKVAAILDPHSVAINMTKQEAEKYKIVKGNIAKIISKKISINDPDNKGTSLGEYTLYKDSLEITEMDENFLVAKKFYKETNNSFPLSLGSQKKVGNLALSKAEELSPDPIIHIGDQVDFFN